jgi:protoporphyrinogen oxidase
MFNDKKAAVVMGGGLAGLSAGYHLTRAGKNAVVLEADSTVGGLSKTVVSGDFRFDLGGHRFHTKNKDIEEIVKNLLGDELEKVHRKSKIYMRGRFFDYPLRPANALFGLGLATVLRIMTDYTWQRLRGLIPRSNGESLEDWVVSNFGRTMFNIYFKEYSEKVWGIDCSRISQGWVAKRIQGLSLGKAVKNAFFKFTGKDIPTLADTFLYPRLGIGRISDRFREEIDKVGKIYTETGVVRLNHEEFRVTGMEVRNGGQPFCIAAEDYISTIPLDSLVRMLNPRAPEQVLDAAGSLSYRDLILVAVQVDRPSVTDQTWIYLPEKKMPFGRFHEPKTWSRSMAPPERTLLVVEFFCTEGDDVWNSPDEELSMTTINGLDDIGFINKDEALGTQVLRVPRAYPLFEVGYEKHCKTIYEYLGHFRNLYTAGRAGMFQYQNMDVAIESGQKAAYDVLRKSKAK